MQFVVVASVAVKWFVVKELSDVARELMVSDQDLHAPRLMASEVANALWRKARLHEIEHDTAIILMSHIPDLPVFWDADENIAAQAFRIALTLDRPVYDCVYLALAYRIGAVVLTADVKFANALTTTGHRETVMALTDYVKTR